MKISSLTFKLIMLLSFSIAQPFNSYSQLLFRQILMSPAYTTWNLNPTITEAGSDYTAYQSNLGDMKINIEVPLLLGSGKVSVSQTTANWHSNLLLSIRREGHGDGLLCVGCSINGGSSYVDISSSSTTFFTILTVLGLLNFKNMELQLKLTGASVTIPAKNYSTDIIFTIGSL